jgi:hypothetical protein
MSIKNRLNKLEESNGTGFHVVFGEDERNKEKETQEYCEQNNINRDSSIVIWMQPYDVATL